MTLPDYLKEVKERLERATPGPWKFTPADECDDWMLHNSEFTFVKQDDSGVPVSKEDGDLIAKAPEDLVKLIRIVEVMREGLLAYVLYSQKFEETEKGYFDIVDHGLSAAGMAMDKADKIARGEG